MGDLLIYVRLLNRPQPSWSPGIRVLRADSLLQDCSSARQLLVANSHLAGHAAWDKSCPAYQRALVKLRARRPDSGFRLFPLADDPYSWESVEGGESLFRAEGGHQRVRPPVNTPRGSPQPPPVSQPVSTQPPAGSQREGSWFDNALTDTPDTADDSRTPSEQC